MGIDRQTDMSGEIQIGPTTLGMVRIYVASDTVDLPMDFTPQEAREIAEELLDAAKRAEGQKPDQKPAKPKSAAPRGDRGRNGAGHGKPNRNRHRRKPGTGGSRKSD